MPKPSSLKSNKNAKGSPKKWGDEDDEDMQSAPLWNYNATTEDNASSSAAMSAEKSNNASPSGKDEKDPNSAESKLQKGVNRSDATPEAVEKFKEFLKGKLQERRHPLSHSPTNSPGRVNPLGSPREDLEDEVMQVDAQGNTLAIPQDLTEQIDAIQEEEVDPESLLLQEMYSLHLRGEFNSIEDVRITFETLLGAEFSISTDFMYDISLRLMQSSDPIGLIMARIFTLRYQAGSNDRGTETSLL